MIRAPIRFSTMSTSPTPKARSRRWCRWPLVDIDISAEEYLEGIGQQLRKQGIKQVDEQVLHSDPAVAIVEFARLVPYNLVAMTTHGRSGMGSWPLGSVTALVERHCCTPVLVIRPADEPPVS